MTDTVAPSRKQTSDHGAWLTALEAVRGDSATRTHAERLVDQAARYVRDRLPALGRHPAYGWSGGKDSLVLELVMDRAGIEECVLVISELEYPAFLAWATDNMPHGLTVEARPWDLAWLASHPEMLFPKDAKVAAKWFSGIQHTGQRRYVKSHQVDVLVQGRRRADGNFISSDGRDHYEDRQGFVRWSPIAHWTNHEVLIVLAGFDVQLPPCYGWPRGFRVGTGSWPARQWCDSTEAGWREVDTIDHSLVVHAAEMLPSAYEYLAGT